MSMGGRALPRRRNGKASVVRASSYPPVVSQRSANTAQTRSLLLPNPPGQSPYPTPRPPTREIPTPRKPAPFSCEPPGQSPYPTPRPRQDRQKPPPRPGGVKPNEKLSVSGKNAKNSAPTPRFAGPAPTAATRCPDAFGQYPAGSRSEDDPCHGLRRLPTGGALATPLSPIGATRSIPLWADPTDFFVIP